MLRAMLAVALTLGIGAAAPKVEAQGTAPGLSSFRSDAELAAFLRKLATAQVRHLQDQMAAEATQEIVVTSARASAPVGITNNQVAGVDEGGIVKLSGETLVILRRGRLFTVSLAGGGMRPNASVNAFPPGVDGSGDWYDEMLLAGDRVIVVGYSYARGGTEVNRFRLGADGSLRFEDSTHLRSNDYYSSRNYASRLIGSTLVYYTPLELDLYARDPLASLPAMRQWQPGGRGGEWRRIVSSSRVFVPGRLRQSRDAAIDTVHSLIRCDLAAPRVSCTGTAVLGASSRSFFVGADAVYLWTADLWRNDRRGRADALLYRLPLDAARPQAVAVRGSPVDQFSFSPDPARAALNVVVQAEGDGDAMWRPEVSNGDLALVRIPMRAFGDGGREVPLARYQPLPRAGWSIRNRFVGDHLLYGSGADEQVRVVTLGDGRITTLPLPHGVGRLDAMGADAIVVGDGEEALGFSTIVLGDRVRRADTFLLPAAQEGEARSHAFFFRADTPDGASGLVGLPVARARKQGTRFLGNSAAIQFLARADRRLADAGELEAAGTAPERADDGCVASCVDWYGNARPIFWQGRVFALMGYEIVEGREADARGDRRVREQARVSFAPRGR